VEARKTHNKTNPFADEKIAKLLSAKFMLGVFLAIFSSVMLPLSSKSDPQSKEAKYWRSVHVQVFHDLPYAAPAKDGGHLLDLLHPWRWLGWW
jgi:hypothetical protein